MQNLTLGLVIGATVSGTFQTAFGQAGRTLDRLGEQTSKLTARQERLGQVMAQSLSRPHANLSRLHSQYQRLGQVIDQTRHAQERLNRAMQFNKTVTNLQQSAKSGMMNEAAKLAMIGGGVGYAVKKSATFEDQIIDIGITAELSKSQQMRIGQDVRASAIKYNQTTDAIKEGLGVLVANNIQDEKELRQYSAILGEFTTAERVTMPDASNLVSTFKTQWNAGSKDSKDLLNILTYAGKAGSFEIDSMAKYLPEFAQFYKGVDPRIAAAELGANFQVARLGAGSSDEAATNMRNFYSKLFAPDTIKDFAKAGIDLQASMKNLVANGMTPAQAMMGTIEQYIGEKSPKAAQEFSKAMSLKDREEREQALARVEEQYKLGTLFQDMQAMSFIRSYQNNKGTQQAIYQESLALKANGKDVIGQDYQKRMGSSVEQYKSLKIFIDDLAITLGDIFKPALLDTANALKPMIANFASWAKENPKIVSSMVGLVAGLIAIKLVFFTISFVVLSVISPFSKLFVVFRQLQSAIVFVKGLQALGRFAPIVMRFSKAIGFVSNAFKLLRIAGMALMTNPIFIAIGLLAVAAYLIYKNWTPIKAFFMDLWGKLKAFANSGIGNILRTLAKFTPLGLFIRALAPLQPYFIAIWQQLKAFANSGVGNILRTLAKFTPLGLFVRAWSAVFRYFSGLGAKFAGFGRDIIQGLINGITAKFSAVQTTIGNLAGQVSGWFKGALGINSPSKVFAKLGSGIPEGVALGIDKQTPQALQANANLAKKLSEYPFGLPKVHDKNEIKLQKTLQQADKSNQVLAKRSFHGQDKANSYVIHFNPTINISGDDTQKQAQSIAQLTAHEMEKILERVEANRRRRAFV